MKAILESDAIRDYEHLSLPAQRYSLEFRAARRQRDSSILWNSTWITQRQPPHKAQPYSAVSLYYPMELKYWVQCFTRLVFNEESWSELMPCGFSHSLNWFYKIPLCHYTVTWSQGKPWVKSVSDSIPPKRLARVFHLSISKNPEGRKILKM